MSKEGRVLEKEINDLHWRHKERDLSIIKKEKLADSPECYLCSNTYYQTLEIYHIISLKSIGQSTFGNTLLLCPNCHRFMRYFTSPRKRQDYGDSPSVLEMVNDYCVANRIYDSFSFMGRVGEIISMYGEISYIYIERNKEAIRINKKIIEEGSIKLKKLEDKLVSNEKTMTEAQERIGKSKRDNSDIKLSTKLKITI